MLDFITVYFHFPFHCDVFYLQILIQYWYYFCFKYSTIFEENLNNKNIFTHIFTNFSEDISLCGTSTFFLID